MANVLIIKDLSGRELSRYFHVPVPPQNSAVTTCAREGVVSGRVVNSIYDYNSGPDGWVAVTVVIDLKMI